MNVPDDEPAIDATEQELAAQLAHYDEALRNAGRAPLADLSSEHLDPEAAQLLQSAQAGLQRLRRARPHGEFGPEKEPEASTATWRKPQSEPLLPPSRPSIAGYEIVGVLGRGGMGVVYKARHLALNRLVALKLILAGAHASQEDLGRFRSEAEAVARLQHPNVVQIHEVGEDPVPFMALEYVAGESLSALLDGTPQPIQESAELAETLARAIHYCHQRGIIHRDLKPANVLIADCGLRIADSGTVETSTSIGRENLQSAIRNPQSAIPKITDFGLAKQLEASKDHTQYTQTGTVLGTVSYMAPEQAAGRGAIGPAADIYALGAILYQLLTGRPPFQGEALTDTLRQVLDDEPVPPRRLRPVLPRDLETICLKCLRKEPNRRYDSARELAEDLLRFREGRPIEARPVGAGERAWKWARRRPAVAALSAGMALLTVLGIALVTWQWRAAVASADAEAEAHRETERQKRGVERLLASAETDRAIGLCETGDVGQGLLRLVRALETAVRAGDTDLERACRINLTAWRGMLLRQRAALPHQHWVWDAAFSPDGKTVLTGSKDRTARLWDTLTGQPIGEPLRHDHPVWCVAFHPDGKVVVTGSGSPDGKQGEVRLWDAATGHPISPPLAVEGQVRTVAFSRDGTRLLTLTGSRARLWRVGQVANLPAGSEHAKDVSSELAHPFPVLAALFTPDGKAVLTAGSDGTARLWDTATEKSLGEPFPHPGPVDVAAFSPDGRILATGNLLLNEEKTHIIGAEARLWDVTSGKQVGPVLPQRGRVKALAFSPDGRLLSTAGIVPETGPQAPLKGEARLWETASGEPFGAPIEHSAPVWSVAFSPDGRTFLTGCEDRSARLWLTATGQQIGPLMFPRDLVRTVAFSPDGRLALLASAGEVAQARIWEVPSGQATPGLLRHSGPVTMLALSPDGRTLLVSGADSTSQQWDLSSHKPVGPPLRYPQQLTAAGFSPDGRTIATVGGGVLEQWDAATGAAVRPPAPISREGCSATFSPDFKLLVFGERRVACCLDLATTQRRAEPVPCPGGAVVIAFHPSGRTFATGGGEGLRLWNTAGNSLQWSAANEGPIHALTFSPDGRLLLTSGLSPRAQLWETATGRAAGPPFRHEDWVWAVAFSPDGRTALTGDQRHKARLWDVATGKPLSPPLAHGDVVHAVVFQADGKRFITGCADRAVRFWDMPVPWAGAPDQVRCEIEVLTGMELDEHSGMHPLDLKTWKQQRQALEQRNGEHR